VLSLGSVAAAVWGAIAALTSPADDALRTAAGSADDIAAKHIDDAADDILRQTDDLADDAIRAADDLVKPFTDNPFDEAGNLKPNVRYKTGEFDYCYETNERGLIIQVEAETLQLKKHQGRLRHDPNTYGKLQGDEAGHLIADVFGGSPELDNLVSQAKNVNRSEYRKLERSWQEALKNGQNVKVNISISYSAESMRPESFLVNYWIDGKYGCKNILNN